jgi:hypothetical protein
MIRRNGNGKEGMGMHRKTIKQRVATHKTTKIHQATKKKKKKRK